MYLKKVDGPRAVTLPDGTVLSRSDLPPPDTSRWVASRKLAVVRGVAYGLMSRSEAMNTYGLSEEEFLSWVSGLQKYGISALKITLLKSHRQL
jgi:hypothetical protein